MVRGVPGRVLHPQSVHLLAAGERMDAILGHGHDPAPEPLHRVSVEAPGAVQEPGRVGEVGGAALVDVDLEVGPALDEGAGPTGVVEVDVGEQDRAGALAAEAGE